MGPANSTAAIGNRALASLPVAVASDLPRTDIVTVAAPPTQAANAQMIQLWLARSASPNTRCNDEREARRFIEHVGKPLGSVRMGDLQDYIAGRHGSSATVALTAAALKSLFAFAQEVSTSGRP